jgi:hypothetical protein
MMRITTPIVMPTIQKMDQSITSVSRRCCGDTTRIRGRRPPRPELDVSTPRFGLVHTIRFWHEIGIVFSKSLLCLGRHDTTDTAHRNLFVDLVQCFEEIERVCFDDVGHLLNFLSSVRNVKETVDAEIPVLVVNHCCAPSTGGVRIA